MARRNSFPVAARPTALWNGSKPIDRLPWSTGSTGRFSHFETVTGPATVTVRHAYAAWARTPSLRGWPTRTAVWRQYRHRVVVRPVLAPGCVFRRGDDRRRQ